MKSGYAPLEAAFLPQRLPVLPLVPEKDARPGMVFVPAGTSTHADAPPVDLPAYWLDRHELTNREFDTFLRAGGYRRPDLWKHPFVVAGREVPFEEAMALFRDRTGRPGPSTWELGSFPEGQAEFPVSGVSWHEAAAWAEFAGESLPTLHHWFRAADLGLFSDLLRTSSFGGKGPGEVGKRPSLSAFGTYDMAGNVREWSWNASGDRRATLGGAWSDPTYLYTGPDALDPMDRSAVLGVRCAVYDAPPPEAAFGPLNRVLVDYSKETPAGDDVFAVYRGYFDYDRRDLDALVIQRTKDVRRAVDSLESRPDVDSGRLAFYGLSMGANQGPVVGAVETRFRTLVLVSGGLGGGRPPEVANLNFAPRVRMPVLMENGRLDFTFPLEQSQRPLFHLLGTPSESHKHVLFDSGHVPPFTGVARETIDGLDRVLGPVAPASPRAPRPSLRRGLANRPRPDGLSGRRGERLSARDGRRRPDVRRPAFSIPRPRPRHPRRLDRLGPVGARAVRQLLRRGEAPPPQGHEPPSAGRPARRRPRAAAPLLAPFRLQRAQHHPFQPVTAAPSRLSPAIACRAPSASPACGGRRVYEVDPVVCPRCQGPMRVVAFITEPRVIRRILDHLGASARRAIQDRAPPLASASVPDSL